MVTHLGLSLNFLLSVPRSQYMSWREHRARILFYRGILIGLRNEQNKLSPVLARRYQNLKLLFLTKSGLLTGIVYPFVDYYTVPLKVSDENRRDKPANDGEDSLTAATRHRLEREASREDSAEASPASALPSDASSTMTLVVGTIATSRKAPESPSSSADGLRRKVLKQLHAQRTSSDSEESQEEPVEPPRYIKDVLAILYIFWLPRAISIVITVYHDLLTRLMYTLSHALPPKKEKTKQDSSRDVEEQSTEKTIQCHPCLHFIADSGIILLDLFLRYPAFIMAGSVTFFMNFSLSEFVRLHGFMTVEKENPYKVPKFIGHTLFIALTWFIGITTLLALSRGHNDVSKLLFAWSDHADNLVFKGLLYPAQYSPIGLLLKLLSGEQADAYTGASIFRPLASLLLLPFTFFTDVTEEKRTILATGLLWMGLANFVLKPLTTGYSHLVTSKDIEKLFSGVNRKSSYFAQVIEHRLAVREMPHLSLHNCRRYQGEAKSIDELTIAKRFSCAASAA